MVWCSLRKQMLTWCIMFIYKECGTRKEREKISYTLPFDDFRLKVKSPDWTVASNFLKKIWSVAKNAWELPPPNWPKPPIPLMNQNGNFLFFLDIFGNCHLNFRYMSTLSMWINNDQKFRVQVLNEKDISFLASDFSFETRHCKLEHARVCM